jgi:hypothetical protein
MGFIAIAIVVITASWLVDRVLRGSAAGRLRDRQDAQSVGRMTQGVGSALPFLGTSSFDALPPPPSVEVEPDLGDHHVRIEPPVPPGLGGE